MTYQEWKEHLDQLENEIEIIRLNYNLQKAECEQVKEQLKDKEKLIKDWKKEKIDDYKLPKGVTLKVGDVIEFTEKFDKWQIEKGDKFIIIFGLRAWQNYTAKIFNNDILGEKEITFCFEKYSHSSNYIAPSILDYIKTMKLHFTT